MAKVSIQALRRKLGRDLAKEQQFSGLVVDCLHGVLGMTKSVPLQNFEQASCGAMARDTERR